MTSPARSHRDRVEAARIAIAGTASGSLLLPPSEGPEGDSYRYKLAMLDDQLRRLSEIQSVEAKIALKRELIPEWLSHIEGWRDAVGAGSAPVQDDIVLTLMVWMIDVGEWLDALEIASIAVGHGLPLPERYRRTTACFVAEEIATAAITAFGPGGDNVFPRAVLDATLAIVGEEAVAGRDMPDEVRAKLFKALALAESAEAEAMADAPDAVAGGVQALREAALNHFRRALALYDKSGVKKMIERLEAVLRKTSSEQANEAGS